MLGRFGAVWASEPADRMFSRPSPFLRHPVCGAQQRAFNNKGVEVEFDGMWSSSLTASSAKGKPDIETVDTTERLKLVAETLDVSLRLRGRVSSTDL